MIHDINMFLKNPYPDDQIYHYALTEDDPTGPEIGFVKESEVCTFFKIPRKRFRALLASAWFDVYFDDDLYNQFFLYKDYEDMPLRYMACERLLPLLPKRLRTKWELMMAGIYPIDIGGVGDEYLFKDATKEEVDAWYIERDAKLDRWEKNTKDGREVKKELDSSIKAFYSENGSSLRIIHNAITHNIIDTSVTVTTERALLPERVTA